MVQMIVGQPIGAGFGKISAQDFDDDDAVRLASEINEHYLVPVNSHAAGLCIDGRACMETLGATKPVVGPAVAGGPSVTAYAAAEMVDDYFSETSVRDTLGRIKEIDTILTAAGITLGAHVSRGALNSTERTFIDRESGRPKTGCGASDEFITILSCLVDNKDAIDATTKQLLGDEFSQVYERFAEAEVLNQNIETYDSQKVLTKIASYNDGKNVEILEGDHAEVLVVFNYVSNMSVNRDELVAETGKQAFTVDIWYIEKLAHAMAEGRPDAPSMYEKLKHAMVAFQVATYLTLCDGSHRPVLLKQPQTQDAPVVA